MNKEDTAQEERKCFFAYCERSCRSVSAGSWCAPTTERRLSGISALRDEAGGPLV